MTTGPTKSETLAGGTNVEVIFADRHSETVFVRQLPIKLFPAYAAAMQNEPRLAELFCDRPSGWADLLTNEALEQIVDAGERINMDFFERWQKRQERRQSLLPKRDLAEELRAFEALQKSNPDLLRAVLSQAGLNLPTPSPSSPSKPD